MCGISGVISPAVIGESDATVVAEMNRRILHRGPDSEGRYQAANAILAMRRLSIVDLAGGSQPIFSEDRSVAIVCNGEIYNHLELRHELEALGYRFSSHSDVETILHAYCEYGIDCLDKLRGMFAFAIWDSKQSKLILARDRMGEKPLYYHRDQEGRVWFSSEVRSLMASLHRQPQLSAAAFNLFMTFQYVPEPCSPCEDIAIFPAGHYAELTPSATEVLPRPYWSMEQAHLVSHDPVRTTRDSLEQACRLMIAADVPVAVALSGGIDSSLVAAISAKYYGNKLRAFTIGYAGRPATDERGFASTLAQELGIEFTEVELSTAQVIDDFPALVAAMDTPIGDIAAYGYYAVSKAARQAGYPVLLSGTGGDEFFWGYDWVREAVNRNERIVRGQRGRSWLSRLLGKSDKEKLDFFGVHPELSNGDKWSRALMPDRLAASLGAGVGQGMTELEAGVPMYRAVSELLNRSWLRSNCLALMDRMSMAHSVEVRLPLLDVQLVQTVSGMRNAGLSDWLKPHKWLLIEALKEVLPKDVLARKKQGFTPPVNDWMSGIVDRYVHLLDDGALVKHGLIDSQYWRQKLQGTNLSFQYKLVLLECWMRLHVDQADPQTLRT